jgi:F420-dependent oxidoreductase-like protein
MKLGLIIGADFNIRTLEEMTAMTQRAETAGFDDVWMTQIFSVDAMAALALIAQQTRTIGLGTAVVPTHPRHPIAMAQSALTTAAASGNRFTLGIGPSHKFVIEGMYGLSYGNPARHTREYIEALLPLLRGEETTHAGEQYQITKVQVAVPGAKPPSVMIAALGPLMLKIAGELTDGTIPWMVGPVTMEGHIARTLNAAAQAAGRPAPRIVGGFPIVVTNDPARVREKLGRRLRTYGTVPSYRAMLDREGLAGPEDLALVGDETELRREIQRLVDAGITDLAASIMEPEEGAWDRTFDFLASIDR